MFQKFISLTVTICVVGLLSTMLACKEGSEASSPPVNLSLNPAHNPGYNHGTVSITASLSKGTFEYGDHIFIHSLSASTAASAAPFPPPTLIKGYSIHPLNGEEYIDTPMDVPGETSFVFKLPKGALHAGVNYLQAMYYQHGLRYKPSSPGNILAIAITPKERL